MQKIGQYFRYSARALTESNYGISIMTVIDLNEIYLKNCPWAKNQGFRIKKM